jgi:hypothetical protein
VKLKKWTYKGIKKFYPELAFEDWLRICEKRQHQNKNANDVVRGFVTIEEGFECLSER